MSYGPNDLVPCPSESARRRHLARGEICVACEPDAERTTVCPGCRERVTVKGAYYLPHDVEGTGVECPKSGRLAVVPKARPAA